MSFNWSDIVNAYTAYQASQDRQKTADLNNQPRVTTQWHLPYANDLIRNAIPYILQEAGNIYANTGKYSGRQVGMEGLQRIQDALLPIVQGKQPWNELSWPTGGRPTTGAPGPVINAGGSPVSAPGSPANGAGGQYNPSTGIDPTLPSNIRQPGDYRTATELENGGLLGRTSLEDTMDQLHNDPNHETYHMGTDDVISAIDSMGGVLGEGLSGLGGTVIPGLGAFSDAVKDWGKLSPETKAKWAQALTSRTGVPREGYTTTGNQTQDLLSYHDAQRRAALLREAFAKYGMHGADRTMYSRGSQDAFYGPDIFARAMMGFGASGPMDSYQMGGHINYI